MGIEHIIKAGKIGTAPNPSDYARTCAAFAWDALLVARHARERIGKAREMSRVLQQEGLIPVTE